MTQTDVNIDSSLIADPNDVPVVQGDTFTITGSQYFLENYDYTEKVSYLTLDELRSRDYVQLPEIAAQLSTPGFSISSKDFNGVTKAAGDAAKWGGDDDMELFFDGP